MAEPAAPKRVNNVEGLLHSLEDMKQDGLSWIERVEITGPEPLDVAADDDLKRETALCVLTSLTDHCRPGPSPPLHRRALFPL